MDREQLNTIVYGDETNLIDYKEQDYDFTDNKGKISFIKDILSMSNTPRDESAYIVLGVRHVSGGINVIVGLPAIRDDSVYQNIFHHTNFDPKPVFRLTTHTLENKYISLLEVCLPGRNDFPFSSKKNFGDKILANVIYHRQNSTNAEAIGIERKQIFDWFGGRKVETHSRQADSWIRFEALINNRNNRNEYVLIAPKNLRDQAILCSSLGNIQWRLVIDLDQRSQSGGIYESMKPVVERQHIIHNILPNNRDSFPEGGVAWYFASGIENTDGSVESLTYKDWLTRYRPPLSNVLTKYSTVSSPKPVTVIIFFASGEAGRHLQGIAETILSALNDRLTLIVIGNEEDQCPSWCQDLEGEFFPLSVQGTCEGINAYLAQNVSQDSYSLPTLSSAPILVNTDKRLWIQESIDMCYFETGLDDDVTGPEHFRKGGKATWADLQNKYDCTRVRTNIFLSKIRTALEQRDTSRFNLYHSPGAGGTTVAKRIIWDLHTEFPVGELLNDGLEPVNYCINYINDLTRLPLLLLVDLGVHQQDKIDDLFSVVKAEQRAVVFLQVVRRSEAPPSKTGKNSWLPLELNRAEATSFKTAYSLITPNRRTQIDAVFSDNNQWNAFSFGLAAYDSDYLGIMPYVASRISRLTPEQKKIIGFLALSYYYAQISLSAQCFADYVGLPANRTLYMGELFAGQSLAALDLAIEENESWRIIHHLVAKEILKQLLAEGLQVSGEDEWKQQLSQWGKEFAALFTSESPLGNSSRDILSKLFINRNSKYDLEGESSKFSFLMSDIPSKSGQIDLIDYITNLYPDEAHFHGHRARVHSSQGSFDIAQHAINEAIRLQEDDNVLLHIKGKVYFDQMRFLARDNSTSLSSLIDLAGNALSSFDKSREINPFDEYAYVSSIHLAIFLIRNIKTRSKLRLSDLLKNHVNAGDIVKYLDIANELLEKVLSLHGKDEPSQIVKQCRGDVFALQDDFSLALQTYQNLLSNPNTPNKDMVRRSIARILLQRNDDRPGTISAKDSATIISLMESSTHAGTVPVKNMPYWIKAVKHAVPPRSLDSIIERVMYWKINSGELSSIYYLYILNCIKAIENGSGSLEEARRALDECRTATRYRSIRLHSPEWLGNGGKGIASLVSFNEVGQWDKSIDFFNNYSNLLQVKGRVSAIKNFGKGILVLDCGLEVFFTPSKFGLAPGFDENKIVNFFLSFSYDGPIAWVIPSQNTRNTS